MAPGNRPRPSIRNRFAPRTRTSTRDEDDTENEIPLSRKSHSLSCNIFNHASSKALVALLFHLLEQFGDDLTRFLPGAGGAIVGDHAMLQDGQCDFAHIFRLRGQLS